MARPRGGKQHQQVYAYAQIPEPKSLPDLVKKIEADPQFKIGVLTIRALAQSITVSFDVEGGGGDDPRIQAIVSNLEEAWTQSLPYALLSFGFGRAAFEKCYAYSPASNAMLLQDLDYLPPEDTKLRVASNGDFAGIKLSVRGKSADIDASKSWWCAIDPTPKEPHGRSRYIGAPLNVWKARQALDKNEETWQDKFAHGHGLLKVPDEYPPNRSTPGGLGQTDDSGEPADPFEDGMRIVKDLRSGGVAVVSSATYPDGTPLWSYDPPTTRQDATPLESRRRVLDAYALRSIGVPERAVTQDTETGSLAMAEAHRQVLYQTVEGFFSQIAASFQQWIIQPLVAMNYGPGAKPKITLTWRSLAETEQAQLITQIVTAVLQSPQPSPLITYGAIDLRKLLEVAELPLGEDMEGAIQSIREAADQASGQPGIGVGGLLAPTGPGQAAPVDKVQDAALNGAQVASMVNILTSAAAQQLPLDSVLPILEAAFPGIDRDTLIKIVRPIYSFRAPAAAISQLSTSPPATLRKPDQLADRAMREESPIISRIIQSLGESPDSVDWGRL